MAGGSSRSSSCRASMRRSLSGSVVLFPRSSNSIRSVGGDGGLAARRLWVSVSRSAAPPEQHSCTPVLTAARPLTCYLQVGVIVPVREQRLWQLPQETLQQAGHVVGVVVTRLQVDVHPTVQHLPQGLLPDAIARDPEQALHMQT